MGASVGQVLGSPTDVSIHAPDEGRDANASLVSCGGSGCFNPRAREGRDGPAVLPHGRRHSFNPRAREGRDITGPIRSAIRDGFNPRAREGRDITPPQFASWAIVSIDAPVKGATRELRHEFGQAEPCFPTRRASEGRDALVLPRFVRHGIRFNPRAREKRDLDNAGLCYYALVFHSDAPVKGCRNSLTCRKSEWWALYIP